jgi:hypothetical protein
MEEIVKHDLFGTLMLFAAVTTLIFAYIAHKQYPKIIDRMHYEIDRKYKPSSLSDKWLYEIGFVKLKGSLSYAKSTGCYQQGINFFVSYAVIDRNDSKEVEGRIFYILKLDTLRGHDRFVCEGSELSEEQINQIDASVKEYIIGLCHQIFDIEYTEEETTA